MRLLRYFLLLNVLFSCFHPAQAATPPEDLPELLKPWTSWVLKGHEQETCPFLSGQETRQCVWSSPLTLNLQERDGSFSQSWEVGQEAWIPLPGDAEHWPQEVKAGEVSIPVLSREDKPGVYLKPGSYRLQGKFFWDELSESFPVPATTALLSLSLNGQKVAFPNVEDDGTIWLQAKARESAEEDSLSLQVFRKITDSVPMQLETRLQFQASGKSREVSFENILPANFIPSAVESELPARWEKTGALKLQLRAGTWSVVLKARSAGPVSELVKVSLPEPWPAEEVWAFEARSDLRQVLLEGAPAIDPKQTVMPDDWKSLPSYRLTAEAPLRFVERQRGDANPVADRLSLRRVWWLDFDGGGFTLHDQIAGMLRYTWRLEMRAPIQLGRVSWNDQDQFITKLAGSANSGVEIRQGPSQISADSRVAGALRKVPAVGWNQDFQQVSGELNLPPGWRAFSILGVDRAEGTWIESWTLLDFFLVLVMTLAFLKLWGWRWGIVALFAFALSFPERNFPQWIWLVVLAFEALRRLLRSGKVYRLLNFGKWASLVVLLFWLAPFLVVQVRQGIYPALERPSQSFDYASAQSRAVSSMPTAAPAPAMEAAPPPPPGSGTESNDAVSAKVLRQSASQKFKDAEESSYDPGRKVQTGPGLPRWDWNRVELQWSGPVEKGQEIRFQLLSPKVNLALAFVRLFLLLGLLGCVMQKTWTRFSGKIFRRKVVVPLLFLILAGGSAAQAQGTVPTPELLEQLKQRLLEKPACFPDCASIALMELEGGTDRLQLKLRAELQAASAIPLPQGDWLPDSVQVDGQEASGLLRGEDENLWLRLPQGVHEVTLSGALPTRESVAIKLPMKPAFVRQKLVGWSVDGIYENGSVEDSLRLTREALATQPETSAELGNSVLTPQVLVTRLLSFDIEWKVATKVERIGESGTPIVLALPLLPGESVLTSETRVEQGKVLVNLAADSDSVEWESRWRESPEVQLEAPKEAEWYEVWQVQAGPLWHVEFQGIPWVQMSGEGGEWLPEWHPWPGEKLAIRVHRPEGVPGQTLTIDHSQLTVAPGLRYSDFTLALDLRSSLGGQHGIKLPAGAQLQSVKINQVEQPLRLDGERLALPLTPGTQQVAIQWQQPEGIRAWFQVPKIDLGTEHVNAEIKIQVPQNRWVLYVFGPRLGPSVLFWSLLLVLALFAWGLSRIPLMPLGVFSWVALGIGVSQFPYLPVFAALWIVGWFLLLRHRRLHPETKPFVFDLRQLFIFGYTFVTLLILFAAIHQGLLGQPMMQVAGNGSSAYFLNWYQDRSGVELPRPWVFSVPLYFYRFAMLAWALWIAIALLRWLKWGWGCFSEGGVWKSLGVVRKRVPPPSGGPTN